MKKIVLVGGCGFIGHNLAINLLKRGHIPTVIDSLSVNNLYSTDINQAKNHKLYTSILNNRIDLLRQNKIDLIIQDAREYSAISNIISRIKPDIIIHLAAVSHANKSNKDPHSTFDHSLRTLENSLDIAKNNMTHLIYMSSSMVYGNFEQESVNEDTKCDPIGIYGNLKFAGELIVKSYNQVFDLPYTIIRPSALYGERCVSRRVGQVFIENSLTTKEIQINGDGKDKLDFTYIQDLIDGISLCCENSKAINQTFNLTYGESRSIQDLLKILQSEFDGLKISFKEKEKFMPERGTLNISKAKSLLNYSPQFPIVSGFLNYINWYKNFWKKINI
tara:strand:- start:818 stop:1816 length:999 start_codon:yes stop_codon:yes gene_type:complete